MIPPRWIRAFQDIKTHCQYILEDTREATQETFSNDRQMRQLVERNLEIIGIAAIVIRQENPDILDDVEDLHQAIGLRNRLAHGYDEEINKDILWETIQVSVPNLLVETDRILESY